MTAYECLGIGLGLTAISPSTSFFFTKARRHFIGERAIEGPPDLVVEVLSPGSGRIDRRDKFKLCAAGKVKHYWIVDPEQKTLESYAVRGGKYARGSCGDCGFGYTPPAHAFLPAGGDGWRRQQALNRIGPAA